MKKKLSRIRRRVNLMRRVGEGEESRIKVNALKEAKDPMIFENSLIASIR